MKVAMVESEGVVSRKDLTAAYLAFDKDPSFPSSSDDRVLNMFHVHQSDQGPQGQEDAREMLARIGRARKSQRLINAAQQQLETVQDAYAFLGSEIGPQSDDAFVTTAYAIRVSTLQPCDNPTTCITSCVNRKLLLHRPVDNVL